MTLRRAATLLLLTAPTIAAIGCGPYVLRGRVVRGERSTVRVVPEDEPALNKPAVEEASVKVTVNPASPARQRVAEGGSGSDGRFALPIDRFGAGVYEEQYSIRVRKKGRAPAHGIFELPGSSERLLITMQRGRDHPIGPDDPFEETQRFLKTP